VYRRRRDYDERDEVTVLSEVHVCDDQLRTENRTS